MMYTHELKWENLFYKVSYVFHADHYLKESSKMCAAKMYYIAMYISQKR